MTIYFRDVFVDNITVRLYAVPEDVAAKSGLEVKGTIPGFSIVAETQDKPLSFPGKEEAQNITDEQSVMTAFLAGVKRRVADEMVEVARKLRIGRSQMKCFYKGCRNDAVFFAEVGGAGGNWYACSKEHMSETTSQGQPVKEDDYQSMIKVM